MVFTKDDVANTVSTVVWTEGASVSTAVRTVQLSQEAGSEVATEVVLVLCEVIVSNRQITRTLGAILS